MSCISVCCIFPYLHYSAKRLYSLHSTVYVVFAVFLHCSFVEHLGGGALPVQEFASRHRPLGLRLVVYCVIGMAVACCLGGVAKK